MATTAMAKRSSWLLVLALAALLLAAAAAVRVDGDATAAAPAPAPAADCGDALLGLAGCLSYVSEGSTVATPDPTCCSGLKDVVHKEVACLCQVFQSGQKLGISLNMTKALQLPAALQQVPRFCSWCAHRVSCACSIFRGPILRPVAVAVVVNSFGVTGSGSNREPEPDQHPSTLPSAFWRCRPLGNTADVPRCSYCCRDSVRVPTLVSWAHVTCHVPSSSAPPYLTPV